MSSDRLNALELALRNEQKEREFYLNNAKRTANPLGMEMFKQIADDELEHYNRLKELHETWKSKGKWPDTVPLTVKNTDVKNVFKKATQAKVPAGDADDLKALQTAIDFEANGCMYYADLRDKMTEPKEKAFFELLANIEHEHYVSLKETEELLKNPAGWYRSKERSGLDGG